MNNDENFCSVCGASLMEDGNCMGCNKSADDCTCKPGELVAPEIDEEEPA